MMKIRRNGYQNITRRSNGSSASLKDPNFLHASVTYLLFLIIRGHRQEQARAVHNQQEVNRVPWRLFH